MRSHPFLVVVFLFLLLAAILVASTISTDAQEATPVPTVVGEIRVEETRFGLADIVPVAPALILYYRIEMPPGTQLAVAPDPGLGAHRVASGTVTIALAEDVTLTRDGVPDEVLPAGEEARLGPGEGFLWTLEIAGELRNDGPEPVVLLIVAIFPEAGLPEAEVGFATPTP